MSKLLITGAAGLHSSLSDFVVPPNALQEATNVILRDAGVIESRRGMIKQASGYDVTANSSTLGALFTYADTLYYSKFNKVYYDTGSAWSDVSSTVGAAAIAGKALNGLSINNAVEFAQNFYICSGNGLYMTDTVGNQLYKAGFDTPPAIINGAAATGQGEWEWAGDAANNSSVAYRVVWGRKDSHDRIYLSEPSARAIVVNSDATVQKRVTGDVPTIPECSSSTFYQVYRSFSVDLKDSAISPSDNLYQVYEGLGADALTLTGGVAAKAVTTGGGSQIVTVTKTAHGYRSDMYVRMAFAAGDKDADEFEDGTFKITYLTADTFSYDSGVAKAGAAYTNLSTATATPVSFPFIDSQPDNLLAVPLYTNPIDSPDPYPNTLPPASCDIAAWKGRMWFANCNRKHTFLITLVGTYVAAGPVANSPDGLRIGDTIVINGMTFTAAASAVAYSNVFAVSTAGSPAANIIATTASLIKTINDYTANTTVRAFDNSGFNGAPGAIRIEKLYQSDAVFNVSVSRPLAWAPYLPTGNSASKNDNFVNRIYYSKPYQPEAVPALNYIDVGAGNKDILRIIAVKEALMIFKEDGLYLLTGDYPFRLDLVDSKAVLTFPKGAIGGESAVYGLLNSGVCRIDVNGVKIISHPIADDFRQLTTTGSPFVCALNETDGVFYLKVHPGSSSGTAPLWYCYNIRTNAWTKLDFNNGKYPFVELDAALFYRPTFDANARFIATWNRITGVTPTVWTSSLIKETRLDDPDNYNLQYIEGDFTELTATVNGAISGGTVGVSKTIVLNSPFASSPSVGDIIYGGSLLNMEAEPSSADYFGLITTINSTTSYTVKQMSTKATGSISNGATVRVLRAYTTRATYDVNSPSTARRYRDITFMFKDFKMNSPNSIVFTDQNSTEVNSNIEFSDSNVASLRFKRVLFPSGHQYANNVTVGIENTEAGTYFKFLGVGLTFEDVSERNSR